MIRKGIIVTRDGFRCLGGPGSGNFDHAGIPGQRGGSAPAGGISAPGDLNSLVYSKTKVSEDDAYEIDKKLNAFSDDISQKLSDEDTEGARIISNRLGNEKFEGQLKSNIVGWADTMDEIKILDNKLEDRDTSWYAGLTEEEYIVKEAQIRKEYDRKSGENDTYETKIGDLIWKMIDE